MNMIAESLRCRESAAAELALAARPRGSRWLRRLLVLALGCGLLFAFRHPLMSQAARLWMVNDPLEKADAAVVLGGNMDTRPFYAGELYRRGLVPLVLVAEVQTGPAVQMQLTPSEADVSSGVLRKMGLPESAIQRFGDGVTSTRDEARGVRRWLEQHPANRLIIATDPFHTRRVRFIFERELRGLPVQLVVTGIPTKRYDPLQWWTSEEATLAFQNEVIKLAYYWLRKTNGN